MIWAAYGQHAIVHDELHAGEQAEEINVRQWCVVIVVRY